MILRIALAVAAVALAALSAAAQAPAKKTPAPAPKQAAPAPAPGGAHPTLLGQYGDWGAYAATSGGAKVCYALATPASTRTNPPNRPRDPVYLFISTRPAENVHNEVSVIIGYQLKPDSEVNVEIGNNKFVMYTKADGAWISNAAEEARMVETMRKGADIVVTGTSSRGTQSTDRYSLKGLSQALDRTAKECK
ncbi:MAG TPA: invasion associated locus B family protein [Xanthobacteraceae bacterium]|nr:invasion associated locus B family protein [Xanthobacteraceae bacterium]